MSRTRAVMLALVLGLTGSAHAGEELTVELPGGAMLELAWVGPGTFTMGATPQQQGLLQDKGMWNEWFANEEPAHEVALSQGFWLGKYEITQAQWESVMGTRPWSGQIYAQDDPNRPATYISWIDVQAFIQRLNEAADEELYRLPTEAEWEYACRAGTNGLWLSGIDEDQLGNYAWYWDNTCDVGDCHARPVGTKQPNPWGLYDMLGNAWEWCHDWYSPDYYGIAPGADPPGPGSGSERVIRGGGFDDEPQYVRPASRGRSAPVFPLYSVGVRLLRMKKPTAVAPASWGQVKAGASAR